MDNEHWIDIPGYEGFYQASPNGRIKSLDRTILYRDGRKHFHKGRIIRQNINGRGYLSVFLTLNGKGKTLRVHSLIALTFIGPRPLRYVLHHKNSNKLDNKSDNLEYLSHLSHNATMDRTKLPKGDDHWKTKLSELQIKAIHTLYSSKQYNQYEIAKIFHTNQGHISKILNSKRRAF